MLDRQIMFNQLQELQRQKKLQELKDTHQQNVINQLSLMHNNKQSSGTQFGMLNYGVPVRDPSQMFMFGDTNLVHKLPNRSVFSQSHFQGPVFSRGSHIESQTRKVQQVNNLDIQKFGDQESGKNQDFTTLDPFKQKILFNTEDNNSWGTSFVKSENIFLKTDKSSDFGNGDSVQEEWSGLSFQNPELSDVAVKKEDGKKWLDFEVKQGMGQQVASSRRQPNMWVDVPQQNPPSTSNRKMESGFGKGSSKMRPRGNRGHAVYRGHAVSVKDVDAFGRSLKQAPMIKKERVDCDNRVPQVTPLSHLKSSSGNYKSQSIDHVVKATGTHKVALTSSSSIYSQHLNVAKENMVVLNSKKRKLSTSEQLSRLHDITSNAELEWAHSLNRLPEKVADSMSIVDRKRRRLILTTQLMQLLFRPAPNIILSNDATKDYDTITYYVAKFGLGDACKSIKRSGDKDLSKVVEGFIDRSKRMEDMLSRFEKGDSTIVNIKVEFQELDKFSVISRFAKFHSREPLVTSDTSSSNGASTMQKKLYPQLYVTASPMPSVVPEGRKCLLL